MRTSRRGSSSGNTLGPEGGFTFGFELSIVRWEGDEYCYGVVLSGDWCRNRNKIHIGGEFGTAIGIELGPTFIHDSKEGTNDVGIGITPYVGAIIPYLAYTLTYGSGSDKVFHDLALLLKFPISVGEPWSFDM